MNIDLRVVYKELLAKRDEITKDIEAAERLMRLAKRPYKKREPKSPPTRRGRPPICRQLVLQAMKDKEHYHVNYLVDKTGRPRKSVQGAITKLLQANKIRRVSKGVYQITGKGA